MTRLAPRREFRRRLEPIVEYVGSQVQRPEDLVQGDIVEWGSGHAIHRGKVVEVVPSGGRPWSPVDVPGFRAERSYVVEGGRIQRDGTVGRVSLHWPRIVRKNSSQT